MNSRPAKGCTPEYIYTLGCTPHAQPLLSTLAFIVWQVAAYRHSIAYCSVHPNSTLLTATATHTPSIYPSPGVCIRAIHEYIHAHIHTCTHIHTFSYIHTYAYMHAYTALAIHPSICPSSSPFTRCICNA